MTRCGTYKDRPHQADMLHVDLWYKGLNVLRDAGSFMYYHEDELWRHYFHSTAAHNTVEIDGQDQMIKGPRFLWYCWPKATISSICDGDNQSSITMQNHSYRRLDPPVEHRREIMRCGDNYTVRDTFHSPGNHTVRIPWRLIDAEWQVDPLKSDCWRAEINGDSFCVELSSDVPINVNLVSGTSSPPEGWESLYYGEKQPSPTLIATFTLQASAIFTTTCNLGKLD